MNEFVFQIWSMFISNVAQPFMFVQLPAWPSNYELVNKFLWLLALLNIWTAFVKFPVVFKRLDNILNFKLKFNVYLTLRLSVTPRRVWPDRFLLTLVGVYVNVRFYNVASWTILKIIFLSTWFDLRNHIVLICFNEVLQTTSSHRCFANNFI